MLFNANSAFFSAISWREQVNFQWDDEIRFVLARPTRLVGYLVLAHWNKSADRHVAPLTNQSLLFLHNAASLAEKQQVPMVLSLIWPDRGSNPRSNELEASTPTITPSMRSVGNWGKIHTLCTCMTAFFWLGTGKCFPRWVKCQHLHT